METRIAPRSNKSVAAKPSIFKDFQRKSLVQLHPARPQQRAHRFRRPPLPPDHLAQIFGMHPQLQHGDLRSFHGLHLHFLLMIHESFGNRFDQILHCAPGNCAPGESGDAQISGGDCGYAIFCKRRKLRTVSLGCAPSPIQYLMRSASSLSSAGFFNGSYVPTASFTRPSRGRVLSMTTTREKGFFFLPILDRRIVSTKSVLLNCTILACQAATRQSKSQPSARPSFGHS